MIPVLFTLLPLLVGAAVGIGAGRWRLWQSQQISPLTQILLFPGVPALFALLGMALGWRIFRRRWRPRVVEEE